MVVQSNANLEWWWNNSTCLKLQQILVCERTQPTDCKFVLPNCRYIIMWEGWETYMVRPSNSYDYIFNQLLTVTIQQMIRFDSTHHHLYSWDLINYWKQVKYSVTEPTLQTSSLNRILSATSKSLYFFSPFIDLILSEKCQFSTLKLNNSNYIQMI